MRLAAAAATLLLLTGTAYAQVNLWGDDLKRKDPEAEAKQQEIDKAYREKIKSQAAPAQAPVNDPWGNVRSSQPASQKQQSNSKTR
jgi:hypothetical protein